MLKGYDLSIDPDDITQLYDRAELHELSDAEVFELAARVIAVPREAPANSFVLHAPLELMARYLLLPLVPATERRAVRERMLWVAAKYESASAPVRAPDARAFTSHEQARRSLVDAMANRDLVVVDEVGAWYAEHATTDEILRLADTTVPMLAAAGHAPIALFLLQRVATTSRSAVALLRPLLRELARDPDMRVKWIDRGEWRDGNESRFAIALARTPRLGLPGSDFIFPLVHQVDSRGIAANVIASEMPADPARAACATLRVAVHSMLQDDPAFAPYGWTHCLTLPHAIFETLPWASDAQRAAAIAATYVVAFRAGEGSTDLDLAWEPERSSESPVASLDKDPRTAAAAWYHAAPDELATAFPALVGRAAAHEDAHFAKYTLACIAAAGRDPGARRLYLAAAASLAAWWATIGVDVGGFDDNR